MKALYSSFLLYLGIAATAAVGTSSDIRATGTATASASAMASAPATASASVVPDAPASFGYKVNWFAVKAMDPVAVLRALEAEGSQPVNWRNGIAAAYEYDLSKPQSDPPRVFVTSPVEGWVFIIGARLPLPDHRNSLNAAERRDAQRFDALFGALSRGFPDVQFFTTDRIVSLNGWARARHGRVERIFCIVDSEVYANDGPQSAEERRLKMLDLSGLSTTAARDAIFAAADSIPGEDDTMAVAGAWSIDPSSLEQRKLPPSSGFIALLNRF